MNGLNQPPFLNLVQVVESGNAYDHLQLSMSKAQWMELGQVLQPLDLQVGHILIERGATDRVLYFVESGALSVHLEDASGRMRLAVLNPGTVVGEGGFLAAQPRSATVIATAPGRVWCLSPQRFEGLAQRHPHVAMQLALALGSVTVRRLNHPSRRLAIT